ncbi:uncharacterized protein TM35_000131760 [Trypanosoma theileri]|uniref:Uncharacterized protein n=1 Tax=Trypanosoma theileri TaxID=67003 RepID=A0A1X0NWW6_9TRYP|nr:uncharacterized protein TM35_000131760 [Trypanosoma theileri]ORC89172.1 hypothetical protein TM35_000131760 [Trypanosoma theileri]
MQWVSDGVSPANSDSRAEVLYLQQCLSYLINLTKTSLEQIQITAESALKSPQTDGRLPTWSKDVHTTLHKLMELVERAQNDVRLVSSLSSSSSSLEGVTSAALSFSSLQLPQTVGESTEKEIAPVIYPFMKNKSNSNNNDNNNNTGKDMRNDEFEKAYQLARLLQERNAAREKLMVAERTSVSLQEELTSLKEEHNRLLHMITQQHGVTPMRKDISTDTHLPYTISLETTKEAMRQMYDRRVQTLEEELMRAREELQRLKSGDSESLVNKTLSLRKFHRKNNSDSHDDYMADNSENTNHINTNSCNVEGMVANMDGTHITGFQSEPSMEGLRRQNTFLRNKITQIREELHTSQQASIGGAEQLNEGLTVLLQKIREQEQELVLKERQRVDAVLAHEMAKGEIGRLKARVEKMEWERAQTQRTKDVSSTTMEYDQHPDNLTTTITTTPVGSQLRLTALKEELHQQYQTIDDYKLRVRQLSRSLDQAQALLLKKDTNMEKLQLELTEVRGMLELVQSQLEHTRGQEEMISMMEMQLQETISTLLPAYLHKDIEKNEGNGNGNESSINGTVKKRLDSILERISVLEAADLQLRQKSDEIVILQDEKTAVVEENNKLQETLSNLSLLFRSMPQSRREVERLMVERDVFFATLQRCERRAEVPNMKETCRTVELRIMELYTKQQQQQQQQQQLREKEEKEIEEEQQEQEKQLEEEQKLKNSPLKQNPHALQSPFKRPHQEPIELQLLNRSPSIVVVEEEEEEEEEEKEEKKRKKKG